MGFSFFYVNSDGVLTGQPAKGYVLCFSSTGQMKQTLLADNSSGIFYRWSNSGMNAWSGWQTSLPR